MHISRTDLNLFTVFDAIYAQGGVTRAAHVLNLSQPAISHALGRLRDRMGDPLFVRQGQRLVPTPLAQQMIGPVRDGLRAFERVMNTPSGFDPALAQLTFKLGMRSLMESTFLIPLTQILAERAPNIALESGPFDRRQMEVSLASGALNAVIDVFLPHADPVRRRLLTKSRSVVVARQSHPDIEGAIDLDTYLAARHVIVTSRSQGLGPEDVALAREGLSRHIHVRCQQINSAMRLISTSNLLLTMSETFARRANLWFNHQILPLPIEAAEIDTYLYWHDTTDADPANAWLRSMVQAAVNE